MYLSICINTCVHTLTVVLHMAMWTPLLYGHMDGIYVTVQHDAWICRMCVEVWIYRCVYMYVYTCSTCIDTWIYCYMHT